MNGWDFFYLRGQGNSVQSFCNFHSHSLTKVNLGIVCTSGVHQKFVQQTALGMLPSAAVVQGQAQCTLWLLKSREGLGCCAATQEERFLLLHPMPQVLQLNLQLMAATACKVRGDQTAKGRRETKPIQFILCLFSILWAVLPESSQGLEV